MTTSVVDPAALVARARSVANIGRVEEARALYRRAVAMMPRSHGLLLELAVLEGQNGDYRSARRALEKALKLSPMDPDVHYNLGEAARAENHYERAARHYASALDLDPAHLDAALGLGESLFMQGKALEALKWLERVLAASPDNAEALHLAGLALQRLGRHGRAIGLLREVARLQPRNFPAKLNLANALSHGADSAEAERLAEECVAAMPMIGDFAAELAGIFLRCLNVERAREFAEKALASGKKIGAAHCILGQIAAREGDFDAAERSFRAALRHEKTNGAALRELARIGRLEPEAEGTARHILHDQSAMVANRIAAGFALYHLLDRRGDYEGAFEALSLANTFQALATPPKVAEEQAVTQALIETFTPQFLAERSGHGYDGKGAAFIVGMPRSGTTLVEQILAAHPDVDAGGEREEAGKLARSIENFPAGAASLDRQWARDSGKTLHEAFFAGRPEAKVSTDKQPGHLAMLGLIAWMLPNARFIYCRRDPRDNALSLFEQSFGRTHTYACDLAALAAVYNEHRRLARHWIESCGLSVHVVDYERLVSDPEPEVRALLDFLGLDWHPQCLEPHKVRRPVLTASDWQVRQPISASSIGRWRKYERQLEPFVQALGDGL